MWQYVLSQSVLRLVMKNEHLNVGCDDENAKGAFKVLGDSGWNCFWDCLLAQTIIFPIIQLKANKI